MTAADPPLRVGIVAGEPSGDQLGAAFITALKARVPGVQISAMAGPRMRQAGCRELAGIEDLSMMGVVEVLRHYPRLRRLRNRLEAEFLSLRPDVFVGIDVPDFVLRIEQKLKTAGIPTVHLVCPQVWAWREQRVPALRAAVTRLLTLFPFETEFLAARGIEARFVGHPLADRMPLEPARTAARAALGLPADATVVALMPGSRRQEYRRHAPLFVAAARRLLLQVPDARFVLGVVNAAAGAEVSAQVGAVEFPLQIIVGRANEVLTAADAALCVSGTITLEAALAKTPAVVAYRMPELTYRILRRLVRVPHIALPNLLLGESWVPEYIQQEAEPDRLAAALAGWLTDAERVARYRARCTELHRTLRNNAGDAAAAAVLELLAARGIGSAATGGA
ncbi:MAG: lipid-A-disaccharide synthase [Bradyrhizobium sp.]|uniref:lipid-A-disaccharide synthase n=1 Tax=Bradyrhizobium sp. TaxID=376 RepID=UPI003D0FAF6D